MLQPQIQTEMIREEYVQHDTARLLKEAGFPQYEANGIGEGLTYAYGKLGNYLRTQHDNDDYIAAAPTQSLAMRWLREKRHLAIVIEYIKQWEYTLLLDYDTDNCRMAFSIGTSTYEAAAEAGIQTACEYLIDKDKSKQ